VTTDLYFNLNDTLMWAADRSPVGSTFVEVATDTVEVLGWSSHGSRPPHTVLRHRRTQRVFTVVSLGCGVMVEPQLILLGDRDGAFTTFGPCEAAYAGGLARRLAYRHGSACWTIATPLHPGATTTVYTILVNADAWQRIPPDLAAGICPAEPAASAPDWAMLLLDRRRSLLAALGPFAHRPDNLSWREEHEPAFGVERIPAPLHAIADTLPPASRPR
jgi:hypothetical protein